MSRRDLFLYRLAASGTLLLLALAVIFFYWYPGAYFAISGVSRQVWVLAGAMFVVGPVLSTFVYKPGKKTLVMDLAILACIEIAAVAVAMFLLYQRQPWFVVFAVDRFEAVARYEVDIDSTEASFDTSRPLRAPRLIVAQLPTDAEELDKLVDETVLQGMADIDRRPEYWRAYEVGVSEVLESARPFADLDVDEPGRDAITEWLGRDASQLKIVPLRGRAGDATMIIDATTGQPLAPVSVEPW